MTERGTHRLEISLAASLAIHLLLVTLPFADAMRPPNEPDSEPLIVEFVLPLPQHREVAPEPNERDRPHQKTPMRPPPKARRAPRPRPGKVASAPLVRPVEAIPDEAGERRSTPPEPPAEPSPEPSPAGQGRVASEGSGGDRGGPDARRVEERIGQMAREALPPPLNDPPAYPELVLDDEGNFTWHFYSLVGKIRPDGTVFFEHHAPPRGKATGRYCLELSTAPGQCQELSTVPWPEDWGSPMGSFPENPIKMWFLRQTEALSDRLSERWQRQSLATAMSAVQRNADRVWRDETLGLRAKRRLLFELWDECEEPRGDDDDRAAAHVGQRARDQIVEYIRRMLPAESRDAYLLDEVRRFNAMRESRQPFAPYPAIDTSTDAAVEEKTEHRRLGDAASIHKVSHVFSIG